MLLGMVLLSGVAGGTEAVAAPKKKTKARTAATAKKSSAANIVATIKTTKGAVFTLKKNGRLTASNYYLKSGMWYQDGKVIRLGFDNADGQMFYYNGGIYEIGSDCWLDVNKVSVTCNDEEGDSSVPLRDFKQFSVTIKWH